MERSEFDAIVGGCKEHPNNKQQPGVCSSCLRDKLSKLCDDKLNTPTSNPTLCSPASPQTFSSASLNYVSPAYRQRHRRHASYVADSVSAMMSFNYGLKKSKSVAFASRNRPREREVNADNRGSKKDSFWSKLLQLTRKAKNKTFMHSRTMSRGSQRHNF